MQFADVKARLDDLPRTYTRLGPNYQTFDTAQSAALFRYTNANRRLPGPALKVVYTHDRPEYRQQRPPAANPVAVGSDIEPRLGFRGRVGSATM
jgi:hypothetical protein